MKLNKNIKYLLLSIPCLILSVLWGCSDSDKDYLDDGAYPPPSIELTSETDIDASILGSNELLLGRVIAPNLLRDVYATLLIADGDNYIEIDKDKRIPFQLDNFPKEIDFTIEIPIYSEDAAGIKIVATDIYTKMDEVVIPIRRIKGIPPTISFDKDNLGSVQFNNNVQLLAHVEGKTSLKSITYVLAQDVPYKELGKPITINAKGDKVEDFTFDVLVDNEDANAIAVTAIDEDGFQRREFVTFSIEGVPEGRAAIFKELTMATEWEIPTDPTKPYIFSLMGINVNGITKHVVSLEEAQKAGNKASLDFMFANIWRNPNGGRLGNHGFAYVGAARIDGGAIGRKPDVDGWLTDCQRNETYFEMIDEKIVAELDLDNFFETTTGNWRTFEALEQLKDVVVGSGSNRQIYQRPNAGTVAGAAFQQIKDGSYIAILRVADGEKKYGIIKVVKAGDDSAALLPNGKLAYPEKENTPVPCSDPNLGYDYSGVASLYGKTCNLEIIIQL